MALEYNSGGTTVTDKPVALTEAVTYGGASLFRGRVSGLAAQSVVGTASVLYGLWSAVSQGGTRFRVITSGVPGSSAEVLWDLQSGRMFSTVSRTVYARYFKYTDLWNEGRLFQIQVPFMLGSTAGDVMQFNCPWDWKIGYYSISVYGNRPTGTLTLGIYKTTGGSGSHATIVLGSAAGTMTAGFVKITAGLEITPAEKIVVRNGTGNLGFDGINIQLREALE